MDPDETLRLFRLEMADARLAGEQEDNETEYRHLQRAVALAEALDAWMSTGGFIPAPWRGGR